MPSCYVLSRRCISLLSSFTTIRRFPNRLLAVLFSVVALGGGQQAWALYSVIYNGTITSLATGANSTPGVMLPSGVAVDLPGNLYVADTAGNRIVEVSTAGVTSVLSISGLSPALSAPHQLTVDAAGNLYIADTGNNRIVKVDTSGNGTVVATPSFTLSGPQGVAVDTAGNLFITDTTNNRVIKVTAAGTASVLATSSGVALTSLSSPQGIAADNFGNLYIVDTGNNRVVKVTTALVGSNISSGISSPALAAPVAVTVGSNGNVYIVDGPTNQRIAVIDPQGDLYDLLFDNENTQFGVPSAIAQSSDGTFYVADSLGNQVNAFQVNTAGLGHVTVGSFSAPLTLNFSVGLYSTLTSVAIYTSGTPNLDFAIAANSGTPCTTGSGGLVNCTVNVEFTPTKAGIRRGALVLSYTDTLPAGTGSFTVPLFGYGDAPVATLSPGVASVVSVGTVSVGEPFQTASDGAGNIYVTSYSNSTVLKIPAGGGTGTVVTIPALPSPTGLQEPTGLAIDGAGNLFIADYLHNRIVEVTPSGTSNVVTIRGLSGGLSLPTALAFDGYGHLFVNDYGHGRIVMLTPDPTAGDGTAGITLGYVYAIGGYSLGNDNSTGIAVDNAGTLYAPDEGNNRVIKVDAFGNESTLTLTGAGNLSGPLGVAVDPSGNLYVMDSGNERIIQKTTTGIVSVMKYTGPSLGSFVFGIAADGAGNVLLSDFTNNRLILDNVGMSALTYPSTRQFNNSATQITKATNLGDQPLIFSANPTYTASFSQDTTDVNSCASATSLSSGQSCDVPIIFSPQAIGSLSAGITLTDNTQNVVGSTQQIAVSGTSTNPGDTTSTALVFSPSSTIYSYGQPLVLTANVTDTTTGHTANIPTGSVTFIDTFGTTVTQLGTAVTLTSGSATVANVILAGIGSHSIAANYSGVTGSYLSSTKTTTITLNKDAVTLSGPTTQPISVTVGHASSISVTATPAYAGGSLPSGTISYSILNSSSTVSSGTASLAAGTGVSTATIPIASSLPAGTYTVTITYAGDGHYVASSSITISLQISQLATTVTWAQPAAITYGTSLMGVLHATAANGSATVPGSFVYTATPSGGSASLITAATVLGAGSYMLHAAFTPTDTTTYSSASASVSLTVNVAASSVALVSSVNPALANSAVTFTATVSSSSGVPTGSVGFYDGTTLLGSIALSSGIAAYTTANLASATHSITAVYSGDTNFATSASTAISLRVGQVATTVTWAQPAAITYGTSLMGVLHATATNGSATVPGTIVYTATPSGGSASPVTAATVLGAGSYMLHAAFTPTDSSTYASASGNVSLTVNLAAASVALVSSLNPAVLTSPVTFTATASSSSGTPTGSVGFYDGTTLLGSASLSSGTAAYTTASLASATHSITAVYGGDINFTSVTSAAVAELVQDFMVSTPTSGTSNTPTATVNPGGTATYTLSLGPTTGTVFPAPVTLSLSGLPPGATGTLSPQTLPAGSSLSNVTLTIQLPQTTAETKPDPVPWSKAGLPVALGLLLLPFAGSMRRTSRRFNRLLMFTLVFLAGSTALVGFSGCGSKASGFFGQSPQTYIVTITATSGLLSHSTNVTLTVE